MMNKSHMSVVLLNESIQQDASSWVRNLIESNVYSLRSITESDASIYDLLLKCHHLKRSILKAKEDDHSMKMFHERSSSSSTTTTTSIADLLKKRCVAKNSHDGFRIEKNVENETSTRLNSSSGTDNHEEEEEEDVMKAKRERKKPKLMSQLPLRYERETTTTTSGDDVITGKNQSNVSSTAAAKALPIEKRVAATKSASLQYTNTCPFCGHSIFQSEQEFAVHVDKCMWG